MVVVLLLLPGCTSLHYYGQAIDGEWSLLAHSTPIAQVLRQPGIPAALRQRLTLVLAARRFAKDQLHLHPKDSFLRYTAAPGPYLVWNVFAARPLSTRLHVWCFPVAGCVPYRGYFSKTQAQTYARRLRRRGYDVYIGGAPLFSTLGWLPDPVPGTLLYYPRPTVVALIFHELAHALIYLPGDARFNESFAVTVQNVGTLRWLRAHHELQAVATYEAAAQANLRFGALVQHVRDQLRDLYRQPLPKRQRLRAKQALLRAMAPRLQQASGIAGRHWNNATLGALATYTDEVPAFECLLAREHGHLGPFYETVKRWAKLPPDRRAAALHQALKGCRRRPATPRAPGASHKP